MIQQKILLVDDREENLFSLQRILRSIENIEVFSTQKPEEALRLCLQHQFSLAILDVQMPGMDGFELAELIRGNEQTEDLSIIFLSAMSTEDHHVVKGYAMGASDYITKPVRAEVLTAKVNVFLELDRSRRHLQEMVTERTHQLADSEARFRGTFENAAIGIAHVGVDGQFLRVNQFLCEMLDYSKEELESKTFQEITVAEDLNKDMELFEQLRSDQIPTYSIEKRYIHRDGHIVWIFLTTAIQRTINGDFDYCISLIRDISRLKQAEQKLELEQSRIALMAEMAGLGLIDCDHATNKIYFSDISIRSLGYQREELGESIETLYKLIHPEDVERVQQHLSCDKIGKWTESLRLRHKDGNYRWFRANALTFINEEDGSTRTIYAQIDVTEEKEHAEAILHAMEKAKASDQAKSQFLANMSHELRTPLNPIIGLSELLMEEDGEEPEEVHRMAKIIQQAGKHMLSLVEEILDFSRLQNGKLLPEGTNCSLSKLFSEVEYILKPQADAKSLNFSIDFDTQYDEIVCPELIVRQIALNLLNNAIKFTETGAIRMLATMEESENSGLMLRIEVGDTGIGIPLEKQAIIFEPFEQVDNSNTRKQSGAGLGLAITRKQIELLNGEIKLKSQEGEGSTFTVRIPIDLPKKVEPNVSSGSKEETSPESAKNHSKIGKTLRIMVVEDQPSNQLVIEKAISYLGHEPLICSSGEDAIRRIENREHFDLILMDLKMPGIDGFETTHRIRQITEDTFIPIFALTANVTQACKDTCKSVGMDGFIEKPIRISELKEILNLLVQSKQSN